MSKDQKTTIEIPVETVEKLRTVIDWIPSTIEFWKKNEEFPFNLICDCCEDLSYDLSKAINP